MKSATEILHDEISKNHEKCLVDTPNFEDFVLDAMEEYAEEKMINLLEFMQDKKMQPNGFGGWGYNSVNTYGSKHKDIIKFFQKSARF